MYRRQLIDRIIFHETPLLSSYNNGILLANNSHGDAGIAYLDDDFEFIGAIYKSNGKYRLTDKNLDK